MMVSLNRLPVRFSIPVSDAIAAPAVVVTLYLSPIVSPIRLPGVIELVIVRPPMVRVWNAATGLMITALEAIEKSAVSPLSPLASPNSASLPAV